MKRERNLNIEMMRGFAMIMMLFYHYNQMIPGILPDDVRATIANEAIGAMALALFYSISGYGTYLLFDTSEDLKYVDFLKRRCLGIMPHYYFVWCATLLFIKPSAIGQYSWKDIGVEVLFLQNYFPEAAMINGVTWTIALMMQFYLVAPLLYKMIKKRPYITVTILVLASLIITRTACFMVTKKELSAIWLVAASMRWLPSNISIFALGMFAARWKKKISCSDTAKIIAIVGGGGTYGSRLL